MNVVIEAPRNLIPREVIKPSQIQATFCLLFFLRQYMANKKKLVFLDHLEIKYI